MTIKEQLLKLREPLAEWARTNGGSAEAATDMLNFLAILLLKPGAMRVAILFNGELPRGGNDVDGLGRVDRSFLLGISRGRSLTLEQADSLTNTTGAGRPLYDLIEECREVARGVKFEPETTDVMPEYRGTRRIEVDGYIVDALQVEIAIGTQLPEHREQTESALLYPGGEAGE